VILTYCMEPSSAASESLRITSVNQSTLHRCSGSLESRFKSSSAEAKSQSLGW